MSEIIYPTRYNVTSEGLSDPPEVYQSDDGEWADADHANLIINGLHDCIKQLEQELAEAKKDQVRYQWLAGQFKMVSPDMGGNHTYQLPYKASTLRGLCVDSIIDAAIKESK